MESTMTGNRIGVGVLLLGIKVGGRKPLDGADADAVGDFHAEGHVGVVVADVDDAAVGGDVLDGDLAAREYLVFNEVAQQGEVLVGDAQDDVGGAGFGVGEPQGAGLFGADGLVAFAVDGTAVGAGFGEAELALDAFEEFWRDGVLELVGDGLGALDGHFEDVDEHALGQPMSAHDVARAGVAFGREDDLFVFGDADEAFFGHALHHAGDGREGGAYFFFDGDAPEVGGEFADVRRDSVLQEDGER
jgi:hypothetical protein